MTHAITDERLADLREWLRANEYCDVGGILIPSGRVAQMLSVLDEHAALKAERDYWRTEQGNENRRWRQAEAELAEVKPLIEAVKRQDLDHIQGNLDRANGVAALEILAAALAHREANGKPSQSCPVSRQKVDILCGNDKAEEAMAILEEVFRREADRAYWASDEEEILAALAILRAALHRSVK
jgi:hypothetical protein